MRIRRFLAILLTCAVVIGLGVTSLPVNAYVEPTSTVSKTVVGYDTYTIEIYDANQGIDGIFVDGSNSFECSTHYDEKETNVIKNQYYTFSLNFGTDVAESTPTIVALYQKVDGKWSLLCSARNTFYVSHYFDTIGKKELCLKYIEDGNAKVTGFRKGYYRVRKTYFSVNVKNVTVPSTLVASEFYIFTNCDNLHCGDNMLKNLSSTFVAKSLYRIDLYRSVDNGKYWTKVYTTNSLSGAKSNFVGDAKYCCKLFYKDGAGVQRCVKAYRDTYVSEPRIDCVGYEFENDTTFNDIFSNKEISGTSLTYKFPTNIYFMNHNDFSNGTGKWVAIDDDTKLPEGDNIYCYDLVTQCGTIIDGKETIKSSSTTTLKFIEVVVIAQSNKEIDFMDYFRETESIKGVMGDSYAVGYGFSEVKVEDYALLQRELIKRYNKSVGNTFNYTFVPFVTDMNCDLMVDNAVNYLVKELTGVDVDSATIQIINAKDSDEEIQVSRAGVYNIKISYSVTNNDDSEYQIVLLNVPMLSAYMYRELSEQKQYLGLNTGV